jgi:hypothetical protein
VREDFSVSVKDQIVGILGSGPTLVASVEGLLQGREKRAVREVIAAYPELFEVFRRGFPLQGPRGEWVRLRYAKAHGRDTAP